MNVYIWWETTYTDPTNVAEFCAETSKFQNVIDLLMQNY